MKDFVEIKDEVENSLTNLLSFNERFYQQNFLQKCEQMADNSKMDIEISQGLKSREVNDELEKRVQEIGLEIFEKSNKKSFAVFSKNFWSNKMMELSMKFPVFKVTLFRFVDVFPSLKTEQDIARHIKEYFINSDILKSSLVRKVLSGFCDFKWGQTILAKAARKNIIDMGHIFIAGENAQKALPKLETMWNQGYSATVDILGEAVLTEAEADDYALRYVQMVEELSAQAKNWKEHNLLEFNELGKIPRVNISVKLSALYSQIDPLSFNYSKDKIKIRLRPILRRAMECGVFINLDMESTQLKDITIDLACEVFCEEEFKRYPYFGLVIQAYLTSAHVDIQKVVDMAKNRTHPITVRLVKGAYWDTEVIKAQQQDWTCPVFTEKWQSDECYEQVAETMLDAYPYIQSSFASHNVRTLSYVMAYAESKGLGKKAIEVQMLYGMATAFRNAVKGLGFRVREYVPVGEMVPGMAYLVRRLLENTANEGFLKTTFNDQVDSKLLLKRPGAKKN